MSMMEIIIACFIILGFILWVAQVAFDEIMMYYGMRLEELEKAKKFASIMHRCKYFKYVSFIIALILMIVRIIILL